MDLKEVGCEDVDWIYVAQVGCYEHDTEPPDSIKGEEFLD
jgi:hypothetical protein